MTHQTPASARDTNSTESTEFEEERVPQIGKAFYDYSAQQNDELSFQRGSVVEIIDTNCGEQGWIYAKIGDNQGMIPENYVRLVGRQMKQIRGNEIKQLDTIGTGSFSVVYKGIWAGNDVALKVPRDSKDTNSKQKIVEEIKKEALIYARLNHPNVVGFYGVCFDSPCCLVLELCNGGTMSNLIRKLSYSIPSRVVQWSIQIASGMEHLHNRDDSLVHADLKPENVLLKEPACLCDHNESTRPAAPNNFVKGRCRRCKFTDLDKLSLKLTDFGLARAESSTRNSFRGSVPWMAPETVRTGQHTKMSDVYSFGILVWELVTNQRPFNNINTPDAMMFIANNQTPIIPDDCPKRLRNLMERCWDTAENRPPFTEILADLKSAQEYADSHKKLDYRNSTKTQMNMDEIERLKRFFKNKFSYIPSHPQAPATIARTVPKLHRKNKKIDKDTIGNPMDFKHVVTIQDNQKGSHPNPKYDQFHVVCNVQNGNGETAFTLPRNYRTRAKSSNPLSATLTPGSTRKNFSTDCDHLSVINPGSLLKSAKSNPELAGKSHRVAPLERTNATRKRNIEPDNSLSKASTMSSMDTTTSLPSMMSKKDSVVNLADPQSLPNFRESRQRDRNQSENSSKLSTLRASSVRAKKGTSIFYTDDDFNDSSMSLNSQSPEGQGTLKKKSSGIIHTIKSFISGSPMEDESGDAGPLTPDRPSIITCYHPHHLDFPRYSSYLNTHMCAEVVREFTFIDKLFREPEIQEHSRYRIQFTDFRNSPNTFLKISQDPQWKRRAVSHLPTVVPHSHSSVSSQLVAQRKYRQSTSVSETDDSLNASCDSPATTSLESPANPIGYEAVRAQTVDNTDAASEYSRPRATTASAVAFVKAKSASPGDQMDWSGGPIRNPAYVPLQESIYRTKKYHEDLEYGDTGKIHDWVMIEQPGMTLDTILNSKPMPVAPPRFRPSNLGPSEVPPALVPQVNWRSNHSPNGADAKPVASPHRKKNILDAEVIGNTGTSPTTPPTGSVLPQNKRHTPERTRRYNLDTPVSGPSNPSPDENDDQDEYDSLPIVNPTYRSQVNSAMDGVQMAPPQQRAPPPPPVANIVPKYLPKTSAQVRKSSPKTTRL